MKKGIDYTAIAVACFMHNGKGEYLVSLRTANCRDEHDTWEPAGSGGLEFGEEIEAGIIREAKEEINAEPYNLEFMGFNESVRTIHGKDSHWVCICYRGQVDSSQVKIMEPDMCAELRWCKVEDIPQPMHSQFPSFLEKFKHLL